jgi:hypothetical protein
MIIYTTILISSLLILIPAAFHSSLQFPTTLVIFLLNTNLMVQMYFMQLRQGMAASLIIFGIWLRLNPLIITFLCGFIHLSSFLLFAMLLAGKLILRLLERRHRLKDLKNSLLGWRFIIAAMASAVTTLIFGEAIQGLALYKTASIYSQAGSLNPGLILEYILKYYIPIFFTLNMAETDRERWLSVSLAMLVSCTIVLSVSVSKVSGRFVYYADAYLFFIFVRHIWNGKWAKFIYIYYIPILLFFALNQLRRDVSEIGSWVDRVSLIFS